MEGYEVGRAGHGFLKEVRNRKGIQHGTKLDDPDHRCTNLSRGRSAGGRELWDGKRFFGKNNVFVGGKFDVQERDYKAAH